MSSTVAPHGKPGAGLVIGIDVGGTQVRVALADTSGPTIASAKTTTLSLRGPNGLVDWAAAAIERLGKGAGVRAVAVGVPGPIDHQRGVLVNPPNLPGWNNVPLVRMLETAVGAPVYLENDASVAALGEFHHGAGRGTRNLIYLTWSTGIGGGLISDGKLISGAHGSAGEVGHMIVDPDGPLDGCGQRGCLEAFAGGHMLASQVGRSAAEIFDAAARGEAGCQEVVTSAARHVGYALINLTNLLDPEVVVIGGGVSRSWALVYPTLMQTLRSSPFITRARRRLIRRAQLGDRAGQVGAIECARARLSFST